MRLHRFIRDFNLQTNALLKITDEELVNQIKNVLRLGVGDQIILADGKLNEALVKIVALEKKQVIGKIISVEKNQNEPKISVTLYCSILKKENFELVVQKSVEVGVSEIIPLITRRTIKLNLKEERLRKIIREAAEQSGRGILPVIKTPINFNEALFSAEKNVVNLLFDQSGQILSKSYYLKDCNKIGIWIGPEGGWDKKEIELAQKKDFKIISLGKLTLRAETAAIIASYLVALN